MPGLPAKPRRNLCQISRPERIAVSSVRTLQPTCSRLVCKQIVEPTGKCEPRHKTTRLIVLASRNCEQTHRISMRHLISRLPIYLLAAGFTLVTSSAWAADIDQVVFRGSFAMEEVGFFHRASQTAIFCDLVQRHPETDMTGWKGMLMRLDGLVGERGSTPREWRATFLRRELARTARERVLSWNAERLLIAHGECAQKGATEILTGALEWI